MGKSMIKRRIADIIKHLLYAGAGNHSQLDALILPRQIFTNLRGDYVDTKQCNHRTVRLVALASVY